MHHTQPKTYSCSSDSRSSSSFHHRRRHSSSESSVTVNNISYLHLIVLLIKFTDDNDVGYCGTLWHISSVWCMFAHNSTNKSRRSTKIGRKVLSVPRVTFRTSSKVEMSKVKVIRPHWLAVQVTADRGILRPPRTVARMFVLQVPRYKLPTCPSGALKASVNYSGTR